ncbi:DUF1752-domain-containing protein [Lophiostoma macrostomum CBS 122681]|uniref:DUF1752-domain-containing protein n=1 Tax=Lophiostoma macrostomum CBS 122681 TaxID=1314788 RepID=A0A6A6SS20_9PLEO|nr:DUF1752-domain-containing protein [Lophiostoma macrostomum CBS 122681]
MTLHTPIVGVVPGSIHTIETRNPENLFGLWSVFSKCSQAMQDGKRYENLAWRVWGREAFCCAPDHIYPPRWSFEGRLASSVAELPELSSSVASDTSIPESAITATTRSNTSSSSVSRPTIQRNDSASSQARRNHITSIDLEKVVSSIQEKRAITPLSPLPEQLTQTLPLHLKKPIEDTTPRPSSPPPTARYVPESSTSTVATALGSDGLSPVTASDASTSTDMSTHSVVHGFAPGCVSTSVRSSTNLNPTPILKTSAFSRPEHIKADGKKKPMFLLGGSSDEDNVSSFEASYNATRSSFAQNMHSKQAPFRKTASFKNEAPTTRTYQDATSESESAIEESAIEDDSESEESEDDNAIEEEDSDEDWEDDDENAGASSPPEKEMFQRVDSRPQLTSRRSLLTTMMHEGDRAQALQNAASRSTPAIRRSRTSTPNGPSTGTSPQDEGLMMRQQVTRSKPIIMTTSNVHPPALSPRTTRRNMLQTELTQSLRQNLLWERQQKNSTTNAVNKRQQSAVSIPALRRAMTTNDLTLKYPQEGIKSSRIREQPPTKNNNSYNDYFDQGLQEYHQKGW